MIITTTQQIEGKQIVEYKQIVFGEVVAGANFIRDFFDLLIWFIAIEQEHNMPVRFFDWAIRIDVFIV